MVIIIDSMNTFVLLVVLIMSYTQESAVNMMLFAYGVKRIRKNEKKDLTFAPFFDVMAWQSVLCKLSLNDSFFGPISVKPANTGPCPYNAKIIEPCDKQEVSGQYISVYHTNLQKLAYLRECSCTITAKAGDTIQIEVTNVPGNKNCGTSIDIIMNNVNFNFFHCTTGLGIKSKTNLREQDNITLKFNTEANTTTSSPFCLYVADFGSKSMNISCSSSTLDLSSTTSLALPSRVATEQTKMQTDYTTTTKLPTSSHFVTNYTQNIPSSTTIATTITRDNRSSNFKQIPLEIVVPAAGGGFVLILVLIVSVSCLCKRRRMSTDEKIKSDALKKNVEDNEMKDNVLYESSDNVESRPVYNGSFKNGDCGYADAEIPTIENRLTIDVKTDNFSSVHQEDHDMPVYAMPNKNRKKDSEQNYNEGPIYALPKKKTKSSNESQTNTRNNNYTKPQTLPKPKQQKSKEAPQYNADGLRYTDLQFEEVDHHKPITLNIDNDKTTYADIK